MPSSARKSSLPVNPAHRRGPQKPHIPFRADDLQQGKKTGLVVNYVDHGSDDFEDFNEVMQQADVGGKTPSRKTGGRKSVGRKSNGKKVAEVQEEDDGGEQSMELDDSPANPNTYFRTTPTPSTSTSNARRLGHASSTALPRRASSVDFDSVPSPRSNTKSTPVGRRPNGAGPSHLSKSTVAYSDEMDVSGDGLDDNNYDQPENHSPEAGASSQYRTPRRTSFSALDQGGSDDEEEEEDYSPEAARRKSLHLSSIQSSAKSKTKGKGKGKQPSSDIVPPSDDLPHFQGADADMTMPDYQQSEPHYEEEDVEEDIARGLQDVEVGSDEAQDEEVAGSQEDEEDERPAKKVKTGKGKAKEKEKPKTTKSAQHKENKEKPKQKRVIERLHDDRSSDPPVGVRRGLRHRYAPLEWWRQEKVIYGRRASGISFVPNIKEIIRIPQEPPIPLGKAGAAKRKRANSVKRGRSESRPLGADGAPVPGKVWNPEEGWDDQTDVMGVVLDFGTNVEVERRVAFTAKMVKPKPAANNDWFFQKVFGDGEFIAAGQLIIPPNGRKPSKGTKDNTYVFYVVEGAINLKIHNTTLVLATGAMFLVPRGNTYFIENISERDARLFFTQARKVVVDGTEDPQATSETGPVRPSRQPSEGGARPRRSSDSAPPARRPGGLPRSNSVAVAQATSGVVANTARRAASTRA